MNRALFCFASGGDNTIPGWFNLTNSSYDSFAQSDMPAVGHDTNCCGTVKPSMTVHTCGRNPVTVNWGSLGLVSHVPQHLPFCFLAVPFLPILTLCALGATEEH